MSIKFITEGEEGFSLKSEGQSSSFGSITPETKLNVTAHYTEGDIECVDYLWDNLPMEAFIGGLEWNTKKYLHRWRHKGNPVKDLKKARDYLNVWIDVMEGKAPEFKEWKGDT